MTPEVRGALDGGAGAGAGNADYEPATGAQTDEQRPEVDPAPLTISGAQNGAEPIQRWLEAHQYTGKVQFPFLDEFIASNVDVHFEAMGDAQFWALVECRETGRQWHLNFGAISTRVKGYAICEEDSPAPARVADAVPEWVRAASERLHAEHPKTCAIFTKTGKCTCGADDV